MLQDDVFLPMVGFCDKIATNEMSLQIFMHFHQIIIILILA